MPELPELEVLKEHLNAAIRNRTILNFIILKPYLLKNYFQGSLAEQRIKYIQRKGKYLVFEMTSFRLIIHLMLRGSLQFLLPGAKIRKTSGAIIEFTDHTKIEFSERGHKKRMSMYILPTGINLKKIEHLGMDPLADEFTLQTLNVLCKTKSHRLKSLLKDQRIISGLGNAYTDEILWLARLSPFKMSNKLSEHEIMELYTAIRSVLEGAIVLIRDKGISETRSFLQVHNRKGKPCPRCKEKIRYVSFKDADTFYCPKCQTGGRVLKDRRLSRLQR
jgi:formamidopyrimidine-DNA glycosylase